jgi:hypothetical protein
VSIASLAVPTEITSDYLGDANVLRKKVIAKSTKIVGTGTVVSTPWIISAAELPAELIDSDETTAEASGAPTLRASTDAAGTNQLPIEIVDFTPASGGVAGGATAEIWVYTPEADATNGQPIYLWWGKAGKTQPAVGDEYGRNAVWPTVLTAFNAKTNPTGSAGDVPDSAGNHDGTSINSMGALVAGPGSIGKAWDFVRASSQYINFGNFDVSNNITLRAWLNADSIATQMIWLAKNSAGGGNEIGMFFWGDGNLLSLIRGPFIKSGATNTGWTYWVVTLEESGANTVVTYYKNGSTTPYATHTVASALIGNVSGGEQWCWGQEWDGGSTSDHWDGAMSAMRVADGVEMDIAKIAATEYNNQSNAADFWDTTATVETGPF